MKYEVPTTAFQTTVPEDRTAIPFPNLKFETPDQCRDYVTALNSLRAISPETYENNFYKNFTLVEFGDVVRNNLQRLVTMLPYSLKDMKELYNEDSNLNRGIPHETWMRACGCCPLGRNYKIVDWTLYDILKETGIAPSLSNMKSLLKAVVKMSVRGDI